MDDNSEALPIDPKLHARLAGLAERMGVSLADLVETVLRAHADEQERLDSELAEDEERWRRYLAAGQTISFDSLRGKLHRLAAEAARKADPR